MTSENGSIVQTGGSIETESLNIHAKDLVDIQGENNQVDVIQAVVESGDFIYTDQDTISIDQIIADGSVTISAESITDHSDDNSVDIQSGSDIIISSLNGILGFF